MTTMTKINNDVTLKELTLKHFNGVLMEKTPSDKLFVSTDGYVIEAGATYAKTFIIDYFNQSVLNGNDLNKTFHKSWARVQKSTRLELAIQQIMHYFTTYGANFSSEMYIPDEVLNVPNLKLKFVVIKAYTEKELINKVLDIFRSGIALTKETINDMFRILDSLGYVFNGDEGVRNKEAIIIIANNYGIYPANPTEFLRYLVYLTTKETLLIKNKAMCEKIKKSVVAQSQPKQTLMGTRLSKSMSVKSNENNSLIGKHMETYGLEKLATIFNRFKPIFLSFKTHCPQTINKISRMSKTMHKPMVQNPINMITSVLIDESNMHWLDNATPFAIFKALGVLESRFGKQNVFLYRIRNGKTYAKAKETNVKLNLIEANYNTLISHLYNKYNENFKGKKFYIPSHIVYALPTSEKMFVGNIPMGTKIISDKSLNVGAYWINDWGCRDLDVSALSINGKIGWNSRYNNNNNSVTYSGDVTNAPNGAVEYMRLTNKIENPYLIQFNIFSGSDKSGYKIVVGEGDKVDCDYMMNPNNVLFEVKTESVSKSMILGYVMPTTNAKLAYILYSGGNGNDRVSTNSTHSMNALDGMFQQWKNSPSLNDLIFEMGGEFTSNPDECDIDLSIDKLEKDTFMNLFK